MLSCFASISPEFSRGSGGGWLRHEAVLGTVAVGSAELFLSPANILQGDGQSRQVTTDDVPWDLSKLPIKRVNAPSITLVTGLLNSSEDGMAQVKITIKPNGPYRVEAAEGSIEMFNPDGTPVDLAGKTAFSLCRCGASVNKPFCDGTHSKIGFQAAEAAVKKEASSVVPGPGTPAKG
jgi:CDGSH-type Zn-finger protein